MHLLQVAPLTLLHPPSLERTQTLRAIPETQMKCRIHLSRQVDTTGLWCSSGRTAAARQHMQVAATDNMGESVSRGCTDRLCSLAATALHRRDQKRVGPYRPPFHRCCCPAQLCPCRISIGARRNEGERLMKVQ
jgi:hypothetical protein